LENVASVYCEVITSECGIIISFHNTKKGERLMYGSLVSCVPVWWLARLKDT